MINIEDYFSVQAFLIILRETLESAIIISVLLAFLHQTFIGKAKVKVRSESTNVTYESTEPVEVSDSDTESTDLDLYKSLKLQVWVGGLLGVLCCLIIGAIILTVFYVLGNDLWSVAEHYWEGTFSIFASIIISVMGIKILRVSKMQEKWKYKLGEVFHRSGYLNAPSRSTIRKQDESWTVKIEVLAEKYNMLILPFVTTLREGMEAIVFLGGIGINENTSVLALVNSAIAAIVIGSTIGFIMYRSGNTLSLQWFLVCSTCFLYLVAAGLFSKGVWNFELQSFINSCGGFDVSETGHGPGSYDIMRSVWHVNCCNGELQEDGAFWMIVTAIFGWTNSATYGSVIAYNVYWLVVITVFCGLIYEEKHGYLPLIPLKWQETRVRKRNRDYQAIDPFDAVPRVSTSSINSQTPLR
ncbi:Iron transporter FTH1 [Spathaspora sp. JA1]|nr:Iron transporter FTH1 [Spathaspora sp. JA1]